jgi:predicted phage terminase large subunit-like protein
MRKTVNRHYTDDDFVNAAVRTDPMAFLHYSQRTLEPEKPFFQNWHIHAVLYHLEQVRLGNIRRSIINCPPRTLKSRMASVAFPARVLGLDPGRKIFGISYSHELAEQHAGDFHIVVQSGWYRRAFPLMRIRRHADSNFFTTRGGFRRTTSINGTLTGLGGDIFIIDDATNSADAHSETVRGNANKWYGRTLRGRLDDQTGSIVIVMQRLHANDLTGYLLEQFPEGWTVLSLPAIAERDEIIPIGDGKFYHRKAGEPLHPQRYSLDGLENIKKEIGSIDFASQYQQNPVPAEGAMIRPEWLHEVDCWPNGDGAFIQSWDTASKGGQHNDYSVCTTWFVNRDRYYLVDIIRGRFEYSELRSRANMIANIYKPQVILVEDSSTGTALAQELRNSVPYLVELVPVASDKITRLYLQQSKFEAGKVLFVRDIPCLIEAKNELLTFPDSKFDDIVDSITQALAYDVTSYDSSMEWVGDADSALWKPLGNMPMIGWG